MYIPKFLIFFNAVLVLVAIVFIDIAITSVLEEVYTFKASTHGHVIRMKKAWRCYIAALLLLLLASAGLAIFCITQ